MGTRNLTMVISNGKTKVAQYGQWDGYPGGQGATALEFLTHVSNLNGWDKFKQRLDGLEWLTDKQAEEIEKDKNWGIAHPYLLRDAGADILNAIHFGEMVVSAGIGEKKKIKVNVVGLSNNEEFAADSLFCEWAYVIDLDKKLFEVYEGFNKTPLSKRDRFYHLQKEGEEYAPVRLVKTFHLENLPTYEEFIKEFETEDEEEDKM